MNNPYIPTEYVVAVLEEKVEELLETIAISNEFRARRLFGALPKIDAEVVKLRDQARQLALNWFELGFMPTGIPDNVRGALFITATDLIPANELII